MVPQVPCENEKGRKEAMMYHSTRAKKIECGCFFVFIWLNLHVHIFHIAHHYTMYSRDSYSGTRHAMHSLMVAGPIRFEGCNQPDSRVMWVKCNTNYHPISHFFYKSWICSKSCSSPNLCYKYVLYMCINIYIVIYMVIQYIYIL